MKSVLISIQPKWCELIASGKKTVEVRKTRPKIETPFKVYIYQTRKPVQVSFSGTGRHISEYDRTYWYNERSGKVFGEFVCDAVLPMSLTYSNPESRLALKEFPFTCLTDKQIIDYLGNGKDGYGWHISDLVIYDKPKELSEFKRDCDGNCQTCKHAIWQTSGWAYEPYIADCQPITRPPQSWCYVEEVQQ